MANSDSGRYRSQIEDKERKIKWIDDEITARSRELESINRKAKDLSENITKHTRERSEYSREIANLRNQLQESEERERNDADAGRR